MNNIKNLLAKTGIDVQLDPRFFRNPEKMFLGPPKSWILQTNFTFLDVMPSFKTMAKEVKNQKPAASKMPTKRHSQPYNLSTEYVQDSDSEEDEKSDTNSTSDDDSLPENPATYTPKGNRQAKTAVTNSNS